MGKGKWHRHPAFVVFNMHVQEPGVRLDGTAVSASGTAESADFIAEAMGPAHLPRPADTSAAIAVSGESCYCEQAFIDRERRAHLEPCVAADLYAGTLAR